MPLVDPVTMSGPARQTAAGKTKANPSDAPLRPVVLHTSPVARTTDAIQLLLLAVLFRLQFGNLVDSPVSALTGGVLVLGALQAAWAVICCPPAGSQGKKAKTQPALAAALSLILTAFTVPIFHLIFVLFGAPLLTHQTETLLCAATLAILAVFPVFYARGVDSRAWAAVCSASAPLDETLGGFWGGIVGAWLGAVPIPLDWDRDWQRWPVTIVCGIVGGHVVGRVVGGIAMYRTKNASHAKKE